MMNLWHYIRMLIDLLVKQIENNKLKSKVVDNLVLFIKGKCLTLKFFDIKGIY